MNSTVISHYRVLHQLGEGGMGVVFAAEDLRLGREVAIKLLRADEPDQEEWLARFEREARLASALKHPNICTIHELGEHAGRPFIVMELLEGRTIKALLEHGPLPVATAVDYAIQIAEALVAAHERDIIHRDIKPANLFVTHGDRLKVLDFGLAKRTAAAMPAAGPAAGPRARRGAGPEVTATGAAVGTAAYMSPEQATGSAIDARTDLFSFGSVLYEMVTGKRAFPGESAPAVLQRLIAGELVPVRALASDVPGGLERIISRALQNDPAARYQSATELLADLRAVSRELSSPTLPVAAAERNDPPSRRSRYKVFAAVGLAAIAVAAVLWQLLGSPRAALTDRDSILIVRFANTTGEVLLDESLLTALKVQLNQSPFLDIVPDDRIAETLRLMGRTPEQELDSSAARHLCERLGVKAMIEGSVARLGSNYVVGLHAMDCGTGASIGREQGEATNVDDVLPALGHLTRSLRTRLGESLPSIRRFDVPIEQATTPSLAALKAYTLGVAERRRGRELESIPFFNQAIAQDREFASAYTMLSTVFGSLGEWRQSEEYARLAYTHHTRVSERERLFIEYQYHDRVTGDQDRAAQTLEIWKMAYPRDARPVNALALIHNRFGRYEQAVTEAREALRRSPGNPFPMSNLAAALRGLGRYDEARKVAEEAVSLGVATTPTRRLLYQLGVLAGDGSARQQLDWARDRPREFDLLSAQAQVAAFEGRLRDATDLYTQAADKARARGLNGTASSFAAHLAWTEALYSRQPAARDRVTQLLATAPDGGGLNAVPRFRAAVAMARVGLTVSARETVERATARYPDASIVRQILVPAVLAAVALERRRPADAIAALEAAAPAERGTVAGLVPGFLRGEALLAAGRPAEARRQFEQVLATRGADPFAPVIPLAHLGIARAFAAEGSPPQARAAYEQVLQIWARADADVHVLQQAQSELAALPGGAPVGRRP